MVKYNTYQPDCHFSVSVASTVDTPGYSRLVDLSFVTMKAPSPTAAIFVRRRNRLTRKGSQMGQLI